MPVPTFGLLLIDSHPEKMVLCLYVVVSKGERKTALFHARGLIMLHSHQMKKFALTAFPLKDS